MASGIEREGSAPPAVPNRWLTSSARRAFQSSAAIDGAAADAAARAARSSLIAVPTHAPRRVDLVASRTHLVRRSPGVALARSSRDTARVDRARARGVRLYLLHEGKLVGLDKLSGHGKSIEDLVNLIKQAYEGPGREETEMAQPTADQAQDFNRCGECSPKPQAPEHVKMGEEVGPLTRQERAAIAAAAAEFRQQQQQQQQPPGT